MIPNKEQIIFIKKTVFLIFIFFLSWFTENKSFVTLLLLLLTPYFESSESFKFKLQAFKLKPLDLLDSSPLLKAIYFLYTVFMLISIFNGRFENLEGFSSYFILFMGPVFLLFFWYSLVFYQYLGGVISTDE